MSLTSTVKRGALVAGLGEGLNRPTRGVRERDRWLINSKVEAINTRAGGRRKDFG